EPLLCAGIADGPPSGAHTAREGIVRDEPSIPDDTDELVLGHDPVSVPYEMNQHVEHLWLDGDDGPVPIQLPPITVDFAVSEYEGHVPASTILRTFSGKPPAFVQDTSRPAAALWRPWPRIGNPHVETCSKPLGVVQVSSR